MAVEKVLSIPGPSTIQQVIVASDKAWITLENDTFYPLWVQLGGPQPSAVPAPGNEASWSYTIGAGNNAKLPAPASAFDGNVWVGTFKPQGTLAGALTQYATVSSFAAAEAPEIATATPTTLLPQQRVVMVPVVPHFTGSLVPEISITAASTFVQLVNYATNFGAGVTRTVTGYLYPSVFTLRGVRWAAIALAFGFFNASGTFITAGASAAFELFAGVPFPFPSVIGQQFSVTGTSGPAGQGAPELAIEVVSSYPTLSAGTPALIGGTVFSDYDATGQLPPPGIGNGASTPPGAVY